MEAFHRLTQTVEARLNTISPLAQSRLWCRLLLDRVLLELPPRSRKLIDLFGAPDCILRADQQLPCPVQKSFQRTQVSREGQ